MWLKQPDGERPWLNVWEETILADGNKAPDTFLLNINITNSDASTTQALVTAGFFSKSLDIWWRKDESKSWTTDNVNI